MAVVRACRAASGRAAASANSARATLGVTAPACRAHAIKSPYVRRWSTGRSLPRSLTVFARSRQSPPPLKSNVYASDRVVTMKNLLTGYHILSVTFNIMFDGYATRRVSIVLAFAAIYLIWGSTFLAIRVA